jgi:hypothetical protein
METDFVAIAKNNKGIVRYTSIEFGMGGKVKDIMIFEL